MEYSNLESIYHSGEIAKPTQLTLHAALGCASASASGGNCASGAVSGVVGELAAEYTKNTLHPNQDVASLTSQQKTNIKEIAGLASGFSAIFTGNLTGLDDKEVAQNMHIGGRVGRNAGENNALYIRGKVRIPFPGPDLDVHIGMQGTANRMTLNAGSDGRGISGKIFPSYGAAIYSYIIPHNEKIKAIGSYGFRSGTSVGVIITNQDNYGLYGSLGVAVSNSPWNITIPKPTKENH